jgi:hypothetical protein
MTACCWKREGERNGVRQRRRRGGHGGQETPQRQTVDHLRTEIVQSGTVTVGKVPSQRMERVVPARKEGVAQGEQCCERAHAADGDGEL